MFCEQLKTLNTQDLYDILHLVSKVKDREYTVKDYAEFLRVCAPNLGVFVVREGGDHRIVGFLQAVRPFVLSKKKAYITIVAKRPCVPLEFCHIILKMAEEWMMSLGADRWECETHRAIKPLARRYKLHQLNGARIVGRYIDVAR
jgi:hypothetical protein